MEVEKGVEIPEEAYDIKIFRNNRSDAQEEKDHFISLIIWCIYFAHIAPIFSGFRKIQQAIGSLVAHVLTSIR